MLLPESGSNPNWRDAELSWNPTTLMPDDVSRLDQIRTMLSARHSRQRFVFPWNELESFIQKTENMKLPFVGYGSLLNHTSAKRTLSGRALDDSRPIVSFGVRRIFNYQIPSGFSAYRDADHQTTKAALNAEITADMKDVMNGVLFPVGLEDIPPLRDRELLYDLEPIPCLDWERPGSEPFFAYVLQCVVEAPPDGPGVNNTLEPHREYYRVCREGAASRGSQFLDFWLNTTFLPGSQRTRAADWEKSAWT
jgi:hypothetical protein